MFNKEELNYILNAVGITRDIDLQQISTLYMLNAIKMRNNDAIEMSRYIPKIQLNNEQNVKSVSYLKKKFPKYKHLLNIIQQVMSMPDGSVERLMFTLSNSNIDMELDDFISIVPDTPEPNVYTRALYYINSLKGDTI